MNNYAIIGMQFGSEAKGALAGYLALKRNPDVVVCNFSPNAGHTFRNGAYKLVVRSLPIGAFLANPRYVLIGPGSIIDPMIFAEEMAHLLKVTDEPPTVIVHPHACVIGDNDISHEHNMAPVTSTFKGGAAASMRRMMRQDYGAVALHALLHRDVVISAQAYREVLDNRNLLVQIEGCQGYGLSMYHGFYPYTTSRDTSIHQLLADIGWPRDRPLDVIGCCRTFPIRIAGDSGPVYYDQDEISWGDLGVEPEITTVTKKVRRVFTFSFEQMYQAQHINQVNQLYLSGCDYLDENDAYLAELLEFLNDNIAPVGWQSFGPDHSDMMQMFEDQHGL